MDSALILKMKIDCGIELNEETIDHRLQTTITPTYVTEDVERKLLYRSHRHTEKAARKNT